MESKATHIAAVESFNVSRNISSSLRKHKNAMLAALKRYIDSPNDIPSQRPRPPDIERPAVPPFQDPPPFHGVSVPDEVTRDSADSSLYDEFFDHFAVAPARDPGALVVFSAHLAWKPFNEMLPGDEDFTEDKDVEAVDVRLQDTRKIYERLFPGGKGSHPRIVRYLGPTPAGYKLERLFPGPMTSLIGLEPANTHPSLLLLYQRWAMQTLSALAFLHSKRVVLSGMDDDMLWVRDDLSIAVFELLSSTCLELAIEDGPWTISTNASNRWSRQTCLLMTEDPSVRHFELVKCDIFDWASWFYALTSHGDPLGIGLDGLSIGDQNVVQHDREREMERMEFHNWPSTEKAMLGSVLVRAWEGEFETAEAVLADVRTALEESGVALIEGACDEIAGVDWRREFEIGVGERYGVKGPRLVPRAPSEASDDAVSHCSLAGSSSEKVDGQLKRPLSTIDVSRR